MIQWLKAVWLWIRYGPEWELEVSYRDKTAVYYAKCLTGNELPNPVLGYYRLRSRFEPTDVGPLNKHPGLLRIVSDGEAWYTARFAARRVHGGESPWHGNRRKDAR